MLVVLTLLALGALAGSSKLSGPVVLRLSGNHGVHRDDLAVVALWLVGVAACVGNWRR